MTLLQFLALLISAWIKSQNTSFVINDFKYFLASIYLSLFLPTKITFILFTKNFLAHSRPIPDVPPVIKAIFSINFTISSSF